MGDKPNKRGQWTAAVVLGLTMVLGSSVIHAEPPPAEEVNALAQQVRVLEETYLVPAALESRFRLETRFNEAKVAYLLEDYQRASIMFVGVIDTADPQQFTSYREAVYLLGDSLYGMRNFRAARSYFRQIVDSGEGPFYQESIVKLLELAGEINDYSGVDELYDRLDELENVSAAIHYTRGKTLYDEGRMRSARPWFQRAATDEDYAFTAQYFEGVTMVGAGELAEAEEIFDALSRRQPQSEVDREVVELALIALGRLAYEREEFETAIDHYLQLPRTSPHFSRALYELTWALVAKGNYRSAIRNLDILLISDPDPRFVPEAKSMMADLAMRLGEYDDARAWFGEVIETFTPVRNELQEFIDEHQDLDEFFVGLVRDELRGLRPDFLPAKVTEWVDDAELVETSRRLISDGMMTQEDIDAVYDSIDELEAAIEMGSSIEAFPNLSQGWTQGIELEARLVDIQDQFIDWELRQVRPFLGSAERQRLADIEEELDVLRQQESQAPRTQEDLEQRDQMIAEQFRVLRQEIDQVAFAIDGLQETLDGVVEYVRRESDRLTQEERDYVADVRRQLNGELQALEEERRRLSSQLDQTRRAFGARDEALVRQRELRREIQQLQAQRAEFVESQSGRLAGSERARAMDVAQLRQRIPGINERLNDFFDAMDDLVEDRMNEIQVTLDAERAQLAMYQGELDQWNSETEGTVAELVMWNYVQVDREFDQLVRRSHVGLVDVDWQQLEDARQERQQLVDSKMETEEMLREAFPDVQ